jgi:hypothetical protein
MTDYTPGKKNAADNLLDQMLTATHTELLTAIAAKQAGTADSTGLPEKRGPRLLRPRDGLSRESILWPEENQKVAELVLTLSRLEALLGHLSDVSPERLRMVRAHSLVALMQVAAEGLNRRSVTQRVLLDLLDEVRHLADSTLYSPSSSDEEQDCAAEMKTLLPQAYEGVRYLFDPSDDTVSCPVS